MRSFGYIAKAGAALLLCAATLPATGQEVRGIPFRDPAQLEQWLSLDDARFNALLQTNWPAVQQILDSYVPAGLGLTDVSLGFAGPQRSCLLDQVPVACRIYMRDLVRINRQKAPTPGAALSPFSPR